MLQPKLWNSTLSQQPSLTVAVVAVTATAGLFVVLVAASSQASVVRRFAHDLETVGGGFIGRGEGDGVLLALTVAVVAVEPTEVAALSPLVGRSAALTAEMARSRQESVRCDLWSPPFFPS